MQIREGKPTAQKAVCETGEVRGRETSMGTMVIQVTGGFSCLVNVPHVTLVCSCPLVLFSEQENSCRLSSNGLFSTINLFRSLHSPSRMTHEFGFPFLPTQRWEALHMLQMTARRTDLACTRVLSDPPILFS